MAIERKCYEEMVLASASRSVATTTTPDQINHASNSLALLIEVTDVTGGGTLTQLDIQVKVGSSYITVYTFSTLGINAAGAFAFLIAIGASSAGTWTKAPIQGQVPRSWRAILTGNASQITYSMIASYMP